MIRRVSVSLALAASLLGSSLSAQDKTELDERLSAIVPVSYTHLTLPTKA